VHTVSLWPCAAMHCPVTPKASVVHCLLLHAALHTQRPAHWQPRHAIARTTSSTKDWSSPSLLLKPQTAAPSSTCCREHETTGDRNHPEQQQMQQQEAQLLVQQEIHTGNAQWPEGAGGSSQTQLCMRTFPWRPLSAFFCSCSTCDTRHSYAAHHHALLQAITRS
jgi:hypothetical protein